MAFLENLLLHPIFAMAFLEACIFKFVDAICATVRELCSVYYAFLPARLKTIPKISDAGSDKDAEHKETSPTWILDSGASFHAVGDKSLLGSTKAGVAATYQARDGRVLTVAGVGTVSCANFHLSDVLYVPDLRNSVILVSVQQLAELGYLVMFGAGQCHVKDLSSGKTVGKGRLHDDDALYHLEFLEIPARARVTTTAP